jgi:hypothetical protein
MTRYLLFTLTIFVALNASAFSQTASSPAPDPTPSSRPAAKRRTFDQFDLSNGIRLPSSSQTVAGDGTPAVAEPVAQGLFDTIDQINESAVFLQGELASALEQNVEISARSQFGKFFTHRMDGIMMLSETSRLDTLGLGGFKTESNKKLLFQVQDSGNDIVQLIGVDAVGYTRFPKEWNVLTEKYNVPLLDTGPNTLRLDKPALLTAMMRRMTSDLALLKRQLVVRK